MATEDQEKRVVLEVFRKFIIGADVVFHIVAGMVKKGVVVVDIGINVLLENTVRSARITEFAKSPLITS